MSRTRRLLSGAAVSYAHQATVIVVGLWLTPFLLDRIGQHSLGLWLVAGQILGYLALMDLGVIAILPREVAFATGKSTPSDAAPLIRGLVAQVRRIVRWQIVALAVTCAIVWWSLPVDWEALRWPLLIVFTTITALYPTRIDVALLQGLQELTFLSKTQLAGWVVSTVVTVGLVIAGFGLYALVTGWAVSMAIPGLAAIYGARRRVSPGEVIPAADVRPYFRQSLWVSVGQVAQVLLNGSDVLLLGTMMGPAAVVPYACTGKLVTVFANHPSLLMHAAQPALSELRGSESRERLATVATALSQAMLMMSGALAIGILTVNHFFVNWWIGAQHYGGRGLTVAFVAMMLLRHWNVATIYTLFCFGHERRLSLTSLCDGVVTIAATWIFVSLWGPIGAPLGSILGVLAIALPLNLRSVARELNVTVAAFVSPMLPLLLTLTALAVTACLGSLWMVEPTFAAVVVIGLPVVCAYIATVVPMAWNGPVGPYLRMILPQSGMARTSLAFLGHSGRFWSAG